MLYIPAGARCRKGAQVGCLCGVHADNEPSDGLLIARCTWFRNRAAVTTEIRSSENPDLYMQGITN